MRIVAEEAKKADHALRAVHIPKTIDNDLVGFDHTPGYPSAARFVAQAFAGANLDNLALKGVYCAVVMGRHAGFLTAASALARKFPDDGPHLIYLPERTFVVDKFLADVKATFERHGRCIIAVSEGIHDEKGEAIITKLAGARGEGRARQRAALRHRRARRPSSARRSSRSSASSACAATPSAICSARSSAASAEVDQREAREVGEKAVQYAMGGAGDGSVAIRRVGDYAVDYPLIPLETVAGKTRVMEDEFIAPAGNDVTPAFYDYLRPLLGADMPEVARLRAAKVEKAERPAWGIRLEASVCSSSFPRRSPCGRQRQTARQTMMHASTTGSTICTFGFG